VGFSVPSSACGIYLEIAVRECEPISIHGVCGSIIPPQFFEEQFTHAALGHLPFVSLHCLPDVQLLAAPTSTQELLNDVLDMMTI